MNKLDKKAGFIKNNPLFILFLGLTTGLAITTNLTNALGMTVIVFVVSVIGSLFVGLFKKFVPHEAILIVSLVINALLVKLVSLFVGAYAPTLGQGLGFGLMIITVNTLILFNIGAFDKKDDKEIKIKLSVMNSLYYGFALIIVSVIRELLGSGTLSLLNPFSGESIFNVSIIPADYIMGLFLKPEGGFLVVGILAAIFVSLNSKKDLEKEVR